MAVKDPHPSYAAIKPDVRLMRISYAGEREVKAARTEFLPYTSGQLADGVSTPQKAGYLAYNAYIMRARYPGFVKEAVQTAIGMLHHLPPKISVPEKMEELLTKLTYDGENAYELLRRINEAQLTTGRIGLLVDWSDDAERGKDNPWIALYTAESIINWDEGKLGTSTEKKLNLVVLDETSQKRGADLQWQQVEQYRVLALGQVAKNEAVGDYRFGIFDDQSSFEFSEVKMKTASYRGKPLDGIPFIFINACDLVTTPDKPPLLDLANLCMTIYRGEADYRQNLFMQGQDTLVVVGQLEPTADGEAVRTGAGALLEVPIGGDAKYIGVESSGLSEQRQALENDKARAGSMGAQSTDTVSRQRESGSSLSIRMAARTADLNQIALAGAKGLENALKIIAKLLGLDEKQVNVIANLDFGDEEFTSQDMMEAQSAKNLGAPISGKSIHARMKDKGWTNLSYEEEIAELEKEKGGVLDKTPPEGGNGDTNPNQNGGGKKPPAKKPANGGPAK